MCKFLCTEIAFLTFPIRNETTSHPIRVIFRHIGKTRKPPCRERVAFFLLFPSIYSFAEEACAHIIYIYIPTAITMAAISDFILSVLWGLQPYCPLFCVNFTAAPPKKQPVAVVAIYILRTFALKLSIVTLYVPCLLTLWTALMSARWLSVMNSTVPLIPPILWSMASPFMRHRPIVLAFIYAWPATHSYLFFHPLPKKIVTCSLQNIYFSYFCLLIIS